MKAPRVAFNKDAVIDFLLRHGEKVVAGMIGIAACGLAWGGVTALRSLRPTPEQQPEAIIADAATTAQHIEAVKIAPDDELTSEKGLAETVAKWLAPKVVPAPPHTILNKPLFGEMALRSSPEILPIEDLEAVAGVVVMALKPKPAGDRAAAERPLNLDAAAAAPAKPAKPPRGGRGGPAGPALPPPPPDVGMMPPRPDPMAPQGKIVPYVLVTGLIPVLKQQEEYGRRFTDSSYRDAALDSPSWNGYRIEKTEVIPGTAEKWTPVDMKAFARRYSADWAGLQQEPFLQPLSLLAEQERRDPALMPIPFCTPLPQLADGGWGFNAVHPWFVQFLERDAVARKAAEEKLRDDSESNSTVFGNPGTQPFDGGVPPPGMQHGPNGMGMMPGGPGAMPGMDGQPARGPEYKMFRFLDLAVVPGRTYRYRVSLVCWNPNFNVASRHLADAAVAKQTTLESPPSPATKAISVPDASRLLVQPMKKQDLKRLKSGMVGVTILGEKPQAGSFSLRSLLMEVGGLANVDPELNKRGDPRSTGDPIVTDRVLLDVRGKLDDRGETRTAKPTPPPEPLEMIFLRPDGSCEVASSADSQLDIDRYRPTLAADGADAAGNRPGQPPAAGESPFGNPFGPKK